MKFNRGAWTGLACSFLAICLWMLLTVSPNVDALAGQKSGEGPYRVLEPLQSGSLMLFPVVRDDEYGAAGKWPFITLDEGLRSGEVVVTEYGRLGGMIRVPHGGRNHPIRNYRGDQVNTLVLVNDSDRPLVLLAGEIVTGGKQDRVIGKDRIVPAHSDPIDLSVFCIEHGRWTGVSDNFGVAGGAPAKSMMVQPQVRSKAMVAQNQQQVWDSVAATTESVEVTAQAPMIQSGEATRPLALPTTSYAKVMDDDRVAKQVDKVAAPLTQSNHEVLQKLKEEHALGVVVAVHGEIVWADVFATPEMLAAYWTKLVRSYAAESFGPTGVSAKHATVLEAGQFVNRRAEGKEMTEGETGIYRYREIRGDTQSTFYLQALLPGTDFDVHMSRVAEERPDVRYGRMCLPSQDCPVD